MTSDARTVLSQVFTAADITLEVDAFEGVRLPSDARVNTLQVELHGLSRPEQIPHLAVTDLPVSTAHEDAWAADVAEVDVSHLTRQPCSVNGHLYSSDYR